MKPLFALLIALGFFFFQGPDFIYHMGERIWDSGDATFQEYILSWFSYAIYQPALSIWNAPFMHPTLNVTAFSESLIGNIWITLPLQKFLNNQILVSNLVIPISFVLSAFTTYLLAFEITGCFWSSIFGGLIFSYCPYRWGQIQHLQLLPFYWAPLAFLFFLRYLKTRKTSAIVATSILIVFQYYCSIYVGTTVITTLAFWLATYLWTMGKTEVKSFIFTRTFLKQIALSSIISLILIYPLASHYLAVSLEWGFKRRSSDNLDFSVEPLSFLVPRELSATYSWLRNLLENKVVSGEEPSVFFGLIPWGLAALGLWSSRKSTKLCFLNIPLKSITTHISLTALLLSLTMMGPKLHLLKYKTVFPLLPYFFVYTFIPGGCAMRVPARFAQPMLLCLAILAAVGFQFLLSRPFASSKNRKCFFLVLMMALLLLDYRLVPYSGSPIPSPQQMPLSHKYLAQGDPSAPYVELPMFVHNPPYYFPYFHFQTLHWRPSVGSQSSFVTPGALTLSKNTGAKADHRALRMLALSPAKTIVIHLDLYPKQDALSWESVDPKPYGFENTKRFGNDIIWEKTRLTERLSTHLKITQLSYDLANNQFENISIILSPAQADTSWSYIAAGRTKIRLHFKTSTGEKQFEKKIQLPPYILGGEDSSLMIGAFSMPASQVVREILIEGDDLSPFSKQIK